MKMQTSVRVDDVFYNEAKEVFSSFELSLPSTELKKRASNIKSDKNRQIYKTANELFEDFGI